MLSGMADERSQGDRRRVAESRRKLNMTARELAQDEVNDWVAGPGQVVAAVLAALLVIGFLISLIW